MWRSFVPVKFPQANNTDVSPVAMEPAARQNVDIIGGGFGGLAVALALRRCG